MRLKEARSKLCEWGGNTSKVINVHLMASLAGAKPIALGKHSFLVSKTIFINIF